MKRTPYFLCLVLLAGIFGCQKLERDNPLDPRNPHSVRTQVILAELFVNDSIVDYLIIDTVYDTSWCGPAGYHHIGPCDSSGCDSAACDSVRCSLYVCDSVWCDTCWCDSVPWCRVCDSCTGAACSLACLDSGQCRDSIAHIDTVYDTVKIVFPYCAYAESALYGYFTDSTALVFAQYHVKHQGRGDSLNLAANDDLHARYLAAAGLTDSVPDLFVNGPSRHLGQANSYAGVYAWLHSRTDSLTGQPSHFTLEGEFTVSGSNVSVGTRLARLGSEDYTGTLTVHIIVMEDLGTTRHHYVVRNWVAFDINGVEAGETVSPSDRTLSLPAGATADNISVIVCLKDDSLNVLQTILIEE